MRTFEFKDDQAYKFWRIELAGKSFTVTFGRIGTKGQEQTKSFASDAAAQAAHDKLVAEKLKKGYVETTKSKAAPASPRAALENAILANPDDLGAHAAYADWLIEQGDPRGEFIQVQLALEDEKKPAKERKELQKREKELLRSHRKEWLGPLAKHYPAVEDARLHFARGWIDSIQTSELTVSLSRALAQAPQIRLLRRLVIEGTAHEEAGEYEPGEDIPSGYIDPSLYPLARSSHLGNIRIFQLGDASSGCDTEDEAIIEVIRKMPRIEELYLLAHGRYPKKLFALPSLQHLRQLQVYHAYDYPIEILAANPTLGKLRHLQLHPHAARSSEEAPIRLKGVKALVRSPHLQSLTHLQLRLSDMGNAGCQEIVKSGILKRLKVLDLRHGGITNDGARILADCPDLKNLELLDLDRNGLSGEGLAALNRVAIAKNMHNQLSALELQDRYYLSEGDWE